MKYSEIAARADRVTSMIMARARKAAHAAGLDNATNVWRNAKIDYDRGRPWREVDYQQLRRALWLLERSHEPHRIVDRWYRRTQARPPGYGPAMVIDKDSRWWS